MSTQVFRYMRRKQMITIIIIIIIHLVPNIPFKISFIRATNAFCLQWPETEDDEGCGSDHAENGAKNSPKASKTGASHLLARGIVGDPLAEGIGEKSAYRREDIGRGDGRDPRRHEKDDTEDDGRDDGEELRNFLDRKLPRRIFEKVGKLGRRGLDGRLDYIGHDEPPRE